MSLAALRDSFRAIDVKEALMTARGATNPFQPLVHWPEFRTAPGP